MNKSKFLKRSLAALLAILMVVAMVPSALAAQVVIESVPTARVFADPGYSISVNGKPAAWDNDKNAYVVKLTEKEEYQSGPTVSGSTKTHFGVSMIEVPKHTLTVVEDSKVLTKGVASVALEKAKKALDEYGTGTYTYTLQDEQFDDDGFIVSTNNYSLIVDVTIEQKSNDADVKGVKSSAFKGIVSSSISGSDINIVLAIDKDIVNQTLATISGINFSGNADVVDTNLKKIFRVDSDAKLTISDDTTTKTLTVTAANGKNTKVYNIKLTNEKPFTSFKVGDYEGTVYYSGSKNWSNANDEKTIYVKLPFGTDVDNDVTNKLVASWQTAESTTKVAIDDGQIAPSNSNVTHFNEKVVESGKATLNFANENSNWTDADDSNANSNVHDDYNTDKVAGGIGKTAVYVKTKKAQAYVKYNVKVVVPQNSPNATLTGIQLTGSNYKGAYMDVTGTNITYYLPKGTTALNKDSKEHILLWGSEGATVELTQNWADGDNEFGTRTGISGTFLGTSETEIKIGEPVYFRVTSQNTKNHTDYTLNVRVASSSSLSLKDITMYDADGEEYAKGVEKDGAWTITVPFSFDATDIAKYKIKAHAVGEGDTITFGAYNTTAATATIQLVESAGADVVFASVGTNNNKVIGGDVATNANTDDNTVNFFVKNATDGLSEANASTAIKVYIRRGDASTERKLSGIVVTDISAPTDTTTRYTSTLSNTAAGGKVNVQTFPYTVYQPYSVSAVTTFHISNFELSTGAAVYTTDGTAASELIAPGAKPYDSKEAGAAIISPAAVTWKTDRTAEIKLYVVSEKQLAGFKAVATSTDTVAKQVQDAIDANDDLTASNANKLYEYTLTLSYTAAATGANLESITSDDKNVSVKQDPTNHKITITVPKSYDTGTSTPEFGLEIRTSDKAKVGMHSAQAGLETAAKNGSIGGTPATDGILVKSNKTADEENDKFKVNGTLQKGSAVLTGAAANNVRTGYLVVAAEDKAHVTTWTVEVKVADADTKATVTGVSVAGKAATLSTAADGTNVWTLNVASNADMYQPVVITADSALASIYVDGDPYDVTDEDFYIDLNDDHVIRIVSEDGKTTNFYTLKVVKEGAQSNADLSEVRAGAYNGTKGAGNAWTIQVPEGTDMSNPSLTLRTADPAAKITSVNGGEYTDGMTVDLSEGKTLTIIVTAADGTTTATHTVSAVFGTKPSEQYTDLPTDAGMRKWVEDAINAGIMGSNVAGKYEFQPNANTQRRYFALMVARADIMANDTTITTQEAADVKLMADYGTKEPEFNDTASEDAKIKAAIVYCNERSIMNGDDKGNFDPAALVNRMQAASILKNWLKLADGSTENTHEFTDWANIANWAKGNINAVANDGIMVGGADGSFGTGNLTREQTAVIMVKAYTRLKDAK